MLNRQKWPSSWIDPNLNSKSHKINLQLFNKESNLDTLWYLFIINSRNNHWKSHRKNSCKHVNGDMFTTEEISLSQLCSLPCVTGTTGRISHQWKSQTALDMIKHRPKHQVAIFLKNIVQNIASLSKKCDVFTRRFRFQKVHQRQI